ncbi:MAG: FecR domain-containing protein, partial [Treponema sp.]|nr:FecR domain-containing protein [Treponema sp.]
MKKKTKQSLSSKASLAFWLAIFFCVAGASVSAVLFSQSLNRVMSKNEEPIATITFKNKTAQRRFIDRVVWDRLRQHSDLYNGDVIHTMPLSSATIKYNSDNSTVEVSENTMIQVFANDGQNIADVSEGSATVSAGENGMQLISAGVTVSVQSGGILSAMSSNGTTSFQVIQGQANLDNRTLSEGEALERDENGQLLPPSFVVTSPPPEYKYLYFTQGEAQVPFAWRLNNLSDQTPMELEFAKDKKFSNVVRTVSVTGVTQLSVNLESGDYYWRLKTLNPDGSTGLEAGSKIRVMQSLAPEPKVPVSEYEYSYRTQKPPVRLIWSESEFAATYQLEIADNPQMTNPVVRQRSSLASSIVSSLGEGQWYWRVTPIYNDNNLGLANPSETSSFRIAKRGNLNRPTLKVPAEGTFINTRIGNSSVNFSWKMENEADSYEILIADNSQLVNPVVKKTIETNYISISPKADGISNRQWYWAVRQIDNEGNRSDYSTIRTFYAIDGQVEQHTIFPSQDYSILQSLLVDSRFTWKSNLPMTKHVQIATDRSFTNIILDTPQEGSSLGGVKLNQGSYYWRLYSKDGTVEYVTEPKLFHVVPPLPAPTNPNPNQANRAVIRPFTPYTFKWSGVDGADYYRFKLYRAGSTDSLIDENFVPGSSLELNMADYPDGYYQWSIQAYANESEKSSRRNGLLTESVFELKHLHPVELAYPNDSTKFEGLEALDNPPVFSWTSQEAIATQSLLLYRVEASGAVTLAYKDPVDRNQRNVQIRRLSSGDYIWNIEAMSTDDLDITGLKTRRFTILPIDPFNPPSGLST